MVWSNLMNSHICVLCNNVFLNFSKCINYRKVQEVYSFIHYSDFIYDITVHVSDWSAKSQAVRLGISFYTHFHYKELLYVSCTYKINQCFAARMAYSFICYSDFVYGMTVHGADISGRSQAIKIGLSLYTYLTTKSCYTYTANIR